MSDTPLAYPPPPPSNAPPPSFQGQQGWPSPVYQPPPGYAAPTAPDYPQPWQSSQPQQPQPVAPPIGVLGGLGYITYQFGGPALASIIAGLASIAMPFVAGRYFIILPIAGVISGARAIQRGRAIGGIVGITVSVLGGIVSLIASGFFG